MIFTYLFIAAGTRLMVGMTLDSLLYIMHVNHQVVPPLGWKREALEILITVVIITPIYSGLAQFTP